MGTLLLTLASSKETFLLTTRYFHKLARMKLPINIAIALCFGCIFLTMISSCKKFPDINNETNISEFGDDESHYNGRNCMDCHSQYGEGDGWFTLAGTVEGNAGNSLIELYRDKSSPYFMAIEVDGEGNFFTTEPIDFGSNGILVGIRTGTKFEWMEQDEDEDHQDVGSDGEIYYGSCNTCHGVSVDQIEPAD